MNENNKDLVIEKYVELSNRLGKLASFDTCKKFGLIKTILYHYKKFSEFQKEAITLHPHLTQLKSPAKLHLDDLEIFRHTLDNATTKKSNKLLVENANTLEYIAQFADQVFGGKIKPSKPVKKNKKIKRVHNLMLSDLHFGSDILGEETGSTDYGSLEESRRFASIIKAAGEYKVQYRDHTKLNIFAIGDFIENAMHDPRTGATVAEQVCRAIHLLSQGIAYLANLYPLVEVEWSTGNHDRNTARHKQRAIHQKWDSLGTIIAYSVKAATKNLSNVSHNIPKAAIGSKIEFGKRIGYTHGDTHLNIGNPGSSLNIKNVETQVNKLNSAFKDKDEYAILLHGHTHTAYSLFLSNGTVVVGNGSLPPPDPFASSIGITENKGAGQWIFESVEGFIVGDLRYIRTGDEYDKDASLDSIIVPFKEL